MTPFEAKGWTKDMKFVVIPDEGRRYCHKKGTIVWLMEDDGTDCPAFTDGINCYYYDFWELEPVSAVKSINGQSGRVIMLPGENKPPITKDTVFNLKLTGEELVYLAVRLGGATLPPTLDNSVYWKVENVLLEFADAKTWIRSELEDIDTTINKIFPPQETPEQKQYKKLLAQWEALGVQLTQLKEKIGGV